MPSGLRIYLAAHSPGDLGRRTLPAVQFLTSLIGLWGGTLDISYSG